MNAGKLQSISTVMLWMCFDNVIHIFTGIYSIAFVAKYIALQCLVVNGSGCVKHSAASMESV